MAPILPLLARASKPYNSYSHSPSGGSIGGGTIGGILIFMLIIFICVFIYEYQKAKKNRPLTTPPTPLPMGKIFKNALLIALTFGFVFCCCESCLGDTDTTAPAANTGGGGVQDAGYMPQPEMQTPGFQPNMNWQPVQSAAADGVQ